MGAAPPARSAALKPAGLPANLGADAWRSSASCLSPMMPSVSVCSLNVPTQTHDAPLHDALDIPSSSEVTDLRRPLVV